MSATVFTIGHYNDAGTLDRKFYLPFSKLDATAAPGVTDDDAAGFVAGSIWADRTNDAVYLCTDNATGAATWVEAGGSGGTGDVVGPASATDSNVCLFDGTTGKLIKDGGTLGTAAFDDTGDFDPAGSAAAAQAASQPLDATLTALAAANWAANTLAIGSGADTVAQVTFAANTFPARASTGNLVAKTISDFALTILDDADAAAVRTTIGAGTGGGDLLAANNLSDLASASTARTNLGLGTLATQSGTFSGTSSGTNTGDQNTFSTIAVSGQSNVVADSTTDTLTLAAGSNITITTDAGTDTITIAAAGGSGTVTDVSCTDGSISVATGTTTPVLSLVQSRLGIQGGTTNLGFSYSASAGAGTITLTDAAGSTPSSSTPVSITFQDGDGSVTTITRTSTLTMTLTSGATLGSTGAGLRVWVVLFNNSGTLELGAINCRDVLEIYPLSESVAMSSTAMSSGADSAGVMYSGNAVTTKYFRILGYFEIDSLTPGTWVAASRVILWTPGMHLPGDVIQTRRTSSSSFTTTTATTPIDDSIPQQSGEGAEFFSQAITPKSAANVLSISTYIWCYNSVAATAVIYAIFQDSTANANFAGDVTIVAANYRQLITAEYRQTSATTSSTTFKLRLGGSGASTTGINGFAGARYYGGSSTSWFQVQEIMA